jgi:outer membrane protein assembly factor BamB
MHCAQLLIRYPFPMRFTALFLCLTSALSAADWPQFLGPTRNAVAGEGESSLPDSLPLDLKPLWKKSVGAGFAGPAVAAGKVIIFHREGSDMTTEALDPKTGTVLWRSTYITDYIDSFGFDNGPRAVPAVAEGKVFTFGPEGRVTAMDLETGKELWNYDTESALGSKQGFFGRSPSPLVIGKTVIIAAGGTLGEKPAGLVALDVGSGKPVWSAAEDEAGCASPVALKDGSVLAWMRNELWLINPSGAALTSLPLRSDMDASVNAATPILVGDNRWFISAGYGVGAHLLSIKDGKISPLWKKEDVLDCHYATPVQIGQHLYGFHGRQESGMKLRCINIGDGSVAWEDPDSVPGGTLIAVGDKLLVITERGELWLVRGTAEKFDQISYVQILRAGHRSHAAYSDGMLFARDTENLIGLKLK